MNNEFNWETCEYPCFGIADGEVVCFSSIEIGHYIDGSSNSVTGWIMSNFKPYTPPKPKTKLWYWEFKYADGCNQWWTIFDERLTEEQAQEKSALDHRKIEALGYICDEDTE